MGLSVLPKPVSATPVAEATVADRKIRPDTESYLRNLASLIAKIFTTFSQISQNDRKEITRLEDKYTDSNLKSARLLETKGSLAWKTAALSLVVFAGSLAFNNVNDRKFVELVSQKVPDVARLFESRYDASQKENDSVASLRLTQIQDKTTKAQTEGNIKDQFAQVLQAEIQRLRSAAASSN